MIVAGLILESRKDVYDWMLLFRLITVDMDDYYLNPNYFGKNPSRIKNSLYLEFSTQTSVRDEDYFKTQFGYFYLTEIKRAKIQLLKRTIAMVHRHKLVSEYVQPLLDVAIKSDINNIPTVVSHFIPQPYIPKTKETTIYDEMKRTVREEQASRRALGCLHYDMITGRDIELSDIVMGYRNSYFPCHEGANDEIALFTKQLEDSFSKQQNQI